MKRQSAQDYNYGIVGIELVENSSLTLTNALDHKATLYTSEGWTKGIYINDSTLSGKKLDVEVINEGSIVLDTDDYVLDNANTFGIHQNSGTIALDTLTVTAKGQGIETVGYLIENSSADTEFGTLTVNASGGSADSRDVSGIKFDDWGGGNNTIHLHGQTLTVVAETTGETDAYGINVAYLDSPTIDFAFDKTSIKAKTGDGGGEALALYTEENDTADTTKFNLGESTLTATATAGKATAAELWDATIDATKLTVISRSDSRKASGISAYNSDISIADSAVINVRSTEYKASGLRVSGGDFTFGEEGGTESLTINVAGADTSYGIEAQDEACMTMYQPVTIAVNATEAEGEATQAIAVRTDEGSDVTFESSVSATVTGSTEKYSAVMHADTEATIKLNNGGQIISDGGVAALLADLSGEISARGTSEAPLVVAGNVGAVRGGKIYLSLEGSESSLTGRTGVGKPDVAGEVYLNLLNGASFNATDDSTMSALVSDGGVFNPAAGTTTVVDTLLMGQNGMDVNLTDAQEQPVLITTDYDLAEDVTETEGITVNGTAAMNNAPPEEIVNHLGNTVWVEDRQNDTGYGVVDTVILPEGAVNGAITAVRDPDTKLFTISETTNAKLESYASMASLSVLSWRHETNDLTKRMGEVRQSPEKIGSWVRLYGSEQEFGSPAVKQKNTSIQLGADYSITPELKVGGAFSYTDGSSTFDIGSGDNKSYGFAAYGTWLADSGFFVDGIVKYMRFDNDFQAAEMKGSTDNNAFSASVETGWHFKLADTAFVEPQLELTYGRVLGDTFTASNNVKIEEDDFDSFIGRVGLRGGFYFPKNRGTIYARASVLHDFDGDFTLTASADRASKTLNKDLGGTWYEIGLGASLNMTDAWRLYTDIERTSGGEIVENWRWNVGMHYAF